jgi:hypothetical protein
MDLKVKTIGISLLLVRRRKMFGRISIQAGG